MNDAVNMTEMIVDICTTHDRASAEQHVREAIAAIAAAAAKEERNKTVVMLRKRSAVILANAGGMGRRDTDAAAAECQRLANWLADPPDINAALRAIPQPAAKEGE